MLRLVVLLNAVLLACGSLAQPSRAAETIKIALIDPLSGPTANLGNQALKHFRFVADRINRSGGVNGRNLEIVPFDNEGNPERTLILLKLAIDKGVRYISQGSSTPVGYAISDAVSKYNSRNPDKPVLFLDWGDLDTGLTEDHCSFWHFRFDANVAMRTKALTDYIASLPKYRKIYLLNPDYPSGVEVEKTSIRMLKEKRPDIEIVGAERIPPGKIKDFSPYVAKIQAADADAVITMNFSFDMILLAKAAGEVKLPATLFTYFGGYPGIPAAIGPSGKGLVHISDWNANLGFSEFEQMSTEYKAKYNEDFFQWRIFLTIDFLASAMREGATVDPIKVAYGLENLGLAMPNGRYMMRKADHQLIEPLYISELTDGVKFDLDGTGLGMRTLSVIAAESAALPTICKMTRPAL